ncbi:hypothetical protein CHARACLAT_031796 [Characodon lateralis]|uniref:Uncharacterized protein n=1 Tax=Characodon lateralis TaxID=208331 RepID=A0ABU7D2C1_9TELE|nr:hypothetical protein [Characodon lateralis]
MFDSQPDPEEELHGSPEELFLGVGTVEPTCKSSSSLRSGMHGAVERQFQDATRKAGFKHSATARSRGILPLVLINNWVTPKLSPSRSLKLALSQRRHDCQWIGEKDATVQSDDENICQRSQMSRSSILRAMETKWKTNETWLQTLPWLQVWRTLTGLQSPDLKLLEHLWDELEPGLQFWF